MFFGPLLGSLGFFPDLFTRNPAANFRNPAANSRNRPQTEKAYQTLALIRADSSKIGLIGAEPPPRCLQLIEIRLPQAACDFMIFLASCCAGSTWALETCKYIHMLWQGLTRAKRTTLLNDFPAVVLQIAPRGNPVATTQFHGPHGRITRSEGQDCGHLAPIL